MKYRLKDICSFTKGATGIMKADGGKYPLVALGEERRSHSEFQFDAKAVIVPLISSTGHGHASMKRVHYQEGKFALGNILCAVIPKDETQLHPKYIHLYLQQFKDSLLVPLMKGAANVSLPMNKLADVEIEVPSFERQLEIIELENEAAELKYELEQRLIAQEGDVAKLRQALLREAIQGKLTKQDPYDGHAKDLLEKIKAEKAKTGKKEKPLPPIKEEETSFDIPENWVWCRLGEIANIVRGGSPRPAGDKRFYEGNIPFLKVADLTADENVYLNSYTFTIKEAGLIKTRLVEPNTLMLTNSGATLGIPKICNFQTTFNDGIAAFLGLNFIDKVFLYYFLKSKTQWYLSEASRGQGQPNLNTDIISHTPLALPPIPEQIRIIKRIEQLIKICDEFQYSIQQSKIENEKLLQGALRDALKKEEIISIEN